MYLGVRGQGGFGAALMVLARLSGNRVAVRCSGPRLALRRRRWIVAASHKLLVLVAREALVVCVRDPDEMGATDPSRNTDQGV